MASLEKRYDGRYRIVFCWQGERRYHSLGKMPERECGPASTDSRRAYASSIADCWNRPRRCSATSMPVPRRKGDPGGTSPTSRSRRRSAPSQTSGIPGRGRLGWWSGRPRARDLSTPREGPSRRFQTREPIERQVTRGGLTYAETKELWGSLFLTLSQVHDPIDHVRSRQGRPCVYVAFCLAAYTDARRSEILRSRVDHVDFEAGMIMIREKKRDRSREMTFPHRADGRRAQDSPSSLAR